MIQSTLEKREVKKLLESRRKINSNGCWIYLNENTTTYGTLNIEGDKYFIHRLSCWIYKNFNLNSDKLICHRTTCHKRCFNPEHLREDDSLGNRLDSKQQMFETWGAKYNKAKTHCPKGHEYKGNNIKIGSHGDRICRECAKQKNKEYYYRTKRMAV